MKDSCFGGVWYTASREEDKRPISGSAFCEEVAAQAVLRTLPDNCLGHIGFRVLRRRKP